MGISRSLSWENFLSIVFRKQQLFVFLLVLLDYAFGIFHAQVFLFG